MATPTCPESATPTTTRLRKARLATFVGFFQLGIMTFAWSTGTSPLRVSLGLTGAESDGSFGLIALAIGIGAAVGAFGVGPILDRLGPRRVVSVLLVVLPLTIIPLGYVTGVTAAFVCALLMGMLRGAVDTSANAHGVEVERYYGRPIMSAFHAAFPAGGFIAGLIGSALATRFTDSPAVSFTLIGVTTAVLGLIVRNWLLSQDELLPQGVQVTENVAPAEPRQKSTATVTLIMIGFGVLLLAAMLSEGAPTDWGQEFVHREVGTTTAAAALAVTLYTGAQFVGRLFGDRLARLIGPRRMVFASGLLAMAGLTMMWATTSVAVAYTGFILLGLGLASVAPLMLSAAGRIDPANAGRNIGIVNGLGFSGLLIGPASITLTVQNSGLQWMPLLPFLFMLAVAVCGPLLMRFAPEFRRSRQSGITDNTTTIEKV